MDPLHATIEEFAADGYTHVECYLPAMPHDEAEADQLASSSLDGTGPSRAAISTAALCGMRRLGSLSQAGANRRCAREAFGAQRVSAVRGTDRCRSVPLCREA